jgi:hypothetical protein
VVSRLLQLWNINCCSKKQAEREREEEILIAELAKLKFNLYRRRKLK